MKATEAKAYILKAKKRIDVIQEELSSISDYENEYEKECNLLSKKIKSIGVENYVRLKKEVDEKYCEYDNNAIRENILKVELKNILNMMVNAAAICLLDELSRQPEKAINKPIHYKVFQEAFENAKSEAWSNIEGLSDYFSSYVFKGCYGSTFDVYIRYSDYKVNLGYFINSDTHIIDIAGAIDFVEKFQYVEIDKIKDIVNEALETKALYKKKAMDLENERTAAMDKYKDIIVA